MDVQAVKDLGNASVSIQSLNLTNLKILQHQKLKDVTSHMLFCSSSLWELMTSQGLTSLKNQTGDNEIKR